jgi:SMODS and SLOG-associating 2TM effector domain family 5
MNDFADKIWYTYKARIHASERLGYNNAHSQHLLVWYALAATALSIITIRFPEILGPNTDVSSAILSVALLVISLLAANVDFRGRAIEMRKNYLALQKLHTTILTQTSLQPPTAELVKEYYDLLNDCENHLPLDDKYWRVMLPKHVALTLTRPASVRETIEIYTYIVIRVVLLTFLYALPLLAAFILAISK